MYGHILRNILLSACSCISKIFLFRCVEQFKPEHVAHMNRTCVKVLDFRKGIDATNFVNYFSVNCFRLLNYVFDMKIFICETKLVLLVQVGALFGIGSF